VSNPLLEYKLNFNNNLPEGVTYSTVISRYFYNLYREINPWKIKAYKQYVDKFKGIEGSLTLENSSFLLLESSFKIEL